MKELKGTKTEQNLQAAFAGESQARNKYTYFASKAKKDGYVQIAAIFEETAANEKEHAKIWYKLLNGGAVETRTVGDWFVAADTLAPRIRPAFAQGADLRSARELRFRASDNFSGIASWRLEIDGEWVPCDRYPMRGTLVHHFDRAADGRLHRAVLQVRDGSGNSARWEGTFRR